MYFFIYSRVKPLPLLLVLMLFPYFLDLWWEKREREGKKKKKTRKRQAGLYGTWKTWIISQPATPPGCLTWWDLTFQGFTPRWVSGEEFPQKPPTKNHGEPASAARTGGMQGANETRPSHSAEGFLNATCIPNTQAIYCIYFQMNLSVSSQTAAYSYVSPTHLNNLIKLPFHYATFKPQFDLSSAKFSMGEHPPLLISLPCSSLSCFMVALCTASSTATQFNTLLRNISS